MKGAVLRSTGEKTHSGDSGNHCILQFPAISWRRSANSRHTGSASCVISGDVTFTGFRRGDGRSSRQVSPKALTKRSNPTGYFVTGGPGRRPKKSWSSWYDEELVIRKGEDILERYDNWAIRELRRLELVWSGWSGNTSLPVETWFGPKPKGFGYGQVKCSDPDQLRLFFLSLLWRAAATSLPDFGEIQLEPEELDRLRTMVLTGNPQPLDFYPISLSTCIKGSFA